MPRNFDQERSQDLEFVIREEKFKMRIVRPEVIASWEDEEMPSKSVDALKYTDEKIKMFLENSDGSHERWDELRKREADPVSMGELNEILVWMVEAQSARPTQQPSPSAAGRGQTGRSSRGA